MVWSWGFWPTGAVPLRGLVVMMTRLLLASWTMALTWNVSISFCTSAALTPFL